MGERVIRTYRKMAQQRHWCDRCCQDIEPGEEYEGRVHVYDNPKRLIVWKTHTNGCDYPPDPEDREEVEVKEEARQAA